MKKDLKVGLLWHAPGHKNLGVDALTRTSMELITAAANEIGKEPQFTIFNFVAGAIKGEDTSSFYEPKLKHLLNPFSSLHSEISKQDVIVDIGEGDSFSDIYGVKRYCQQILAKLVVAYRQVPLIMAPQTIGPFRSSCTKIGARWALNKAKMIAVRDPASKSFANSLIGQEVELYSDLAFGLKYDSYPQSGMIGLNVSGLLYDSSVAHFSNSEFNYRVFIDEIIDDLLARGERVCLVPHVLNPGSIDDDVEVSKQLANNNPGLEVAPEFRSAAEAKSFISSLRGLIAARMHACIGGVSSGVPVLPIAYSRKFNGLFIDNGYPLLIDATKEPHNVAKDKYYEFLDNLPHIQSAAANFSHTQKSRLDAYKENLVKIFAEIK